MLISAGRRVQAFVLAELVAAVFVVAVLAAMLAIVWPDTRRQARLGECLANLRHFGAMTGAYAADSADRVWTYNWRANGPDNPRNPTTYADLQNAPDDLYAALYQFVALMRDRAGRLDFAPEYGIIPQIRHSPLILADYQSLRLPLGMGVCPEDKNRLQWAADPHGYDACQYHPNPGCGDNNSKRWPYGSSYQLPPSFWSPDQTDSNHPTVTQGPAQNNYYVSGQVPLGRRTIAEVRYPARKVLLYEEHARHFLPRVMFFAYEDARVPSLAVDGSAAVRLTHETNRGWHPDAPANPAPTFINYTPSPAPEDWEPPNYSPSGQASVSVPGHYRWTRRGLLGWDFGGADVPP